MLLAAMILDDKLYTHNKNDQTNNCTSYMQLQHTQSPLKNELKRQLAEIRREGQE